MANAATALDNVKSDGEWSRANAQAILNDIEGVNAIVKQFRVSNAFWKHVSAAVQSEIVATLKRIYDAEKITE